MAPSLSDALRPSSLGLLASIYLVFRLIHRFILWPKYLSPLRRLPTPPGAKLLSGHVLQVLKDQSAKSMREWVKTYGTTFRVAGPFSADHMTTIEPEHLEKILGKDAQNYVKPDLMCKVLGSMFGYGLLAVAGSEHRLMRKAMNPAFSMAILTSQTHFHYEVIDGLVKLFDEQIITSPDPSEGKVMLMYEWMSKATLDIICLTGFGYKADSVHNPHNILADAYSLRSVAQSGPNLAKLMYLTFIPGAMKLMRSSWMYRHRHWLNYTRYADYFRILVESNHTIEEISKELLKEKINDSVTVADSEGKRDIMSILVRARKADLEKDPSIYSMSDAAMLDQVLTFLGAGHTATAIACTAALWSLANDQESQRKLREEVAPVLKDNPHPDYRTLKGLQWLECVINETLRIFPPIPMDERVALKTDYIGDVLVPEGTVIYLSILLINTNKKVWGEDAEEFKPSRWLNLPKGYNPNYSSLTFLTGPHACIGKTMAVMEIKFMVAFMIANFTFEPAYEGQVAKLRGGISMNFLDGMPLRVKRV